MRRRPLLNNFAKGYQTLCEDSNTKVCELFTKTYTY